MFYTFRGTFRLSNTYYSCLTGYQCHVDEWGWCQIVLIIWTSWLIYGLYDFVRIFRVLYTNIHNLGHFWALKYLFLSLPGHQCHVHEWGWCQIVLIVWTSWLIYGLYDFVRIFKVLYTNIHNLGHFWAIKCLFLVPTWSPVPCTWMRMMSRCPIRWSDSTHIWFTSLSLRFYWVM